MNKKTKEVLKLSHLIFFLRTIKSIYKNKYEKNPRNISFAFCRGRTIFYSGAGQDIFSLGWVIVRGKIKFCWGGAVLYSDADAPIH
jgi:hypothetical protein